MARNCFNCKFWEDDKCHNQAREYFHSEKDTRGDENYCWWWQCKNDNINHPSHYQGQHECIDIMRVMFGDEAVKGFCRCNAYKYRYRAGRKDGNTAEQDLQKAEWYENYLIEMEEESNDM